MGKGLIILAGLAGVMMGGMISATDLSAREHPLDLSTRTQVTQEGEVTVALTLANRGDRPLFDLRPMFHFHHSLSALPGIDRLEPGQSVTLENKNHPPVMRVGSYPIVAMVPYKELKDAALSRTRIHTGSFYFEEPKVSMIEGTLVTEVDENISRVKILLKNPSPAFKNIRLMLLLPPQLKADRFQGMMGFTIRGGEEKYFEVPVRKVTDAPGEIYPVHLMVEYGEMMKHYSGDIRGQIDFGSTSHWLQILVLALLTIILFLAFSGKFHLLKMSRSH